MPGVARCAASPSRVTRPRPHTCQDGRQHWGGSGLLSASVYLPWFPTAAGERCTKCKGSPHLAGLRQEVELGVLRDGQRVGAFHQAAHLRGWEGGPQYVPSPGKSRGHSGGQCCKALALHVCGVLLTCGLRQHQCAAHLLCQPWHPTLLKARALRSAGRHCACLWVPVAEKLQHLALALLALLLRGAKRDAEPSRWYFSAPAGQAIIMPLAADVLLQSPSCRRIKHMQLPAGTACSAPLTCAPSRLGWGSLQ